MAHLYKRGRWFWISYYLNGKLTQKSLQTDNERVARDEKKKIEYELSIGELHIASKLPLTVILEDFCKHLRRTRTRKTYKNDISRLRIFFGPVCDSLKLHSPGKQEGTCDWRAQKEEQQEIMRNNEKNQLKIVCTLLLSICVIQTNDCATALECSTIAHQILYLEGKDRTAVEVATLEKMIADIDIPRHKKLDGGLINAIETLRSIDKCLRDYHFVYRPVVLLSDSLSIQTIPLIDVDGGSGTASPLINNRERWLECHRDGVVDKRNENISGYYADCDTLTCIYLAIGEVHHLPLRAIATPSHLFIRWYLADGNYINWETTSGRTITDAQYIERLNIDKKAIGSGIYLRDLKEIEVIALAHVNMGVHQTRNGNPILAVSSFTKALELYPNSPYALYNRGWFYYNLGQYDKAEHDMLKAIELNRNYLKAYIRCGLIYFRKGDTDKAISNFTTVLKHEPEHSEARWYRAAVLEAIGDYQKAIEDYTVMVESGRVREAYGKRAQVHSENKAYAQAKHDYLKAISLNPESVDILNCAAWFFATVPASEYADASLAIRLATKAVEKKQTAVNFDTMAAAYARSGDFELACKYQEKAIHQTTNEDLKENFRQRSALYRNKRKYIEN